MANLILIFSLIIFLYVYVRKQIDKYKARVYANMHKLLGVKRYKQVSSYHSFIYVYRDKLWVKIGKSTNIQKRIITHQTAHATPLHIIAIIPVQNAHVAEMILHKRYAKQRYKREFFWLHPILILELTAVSNSQWKQHLQNRING